MHFHQVAQFHVSDVDDEIPQEAIRRMGVGFFRPIEEPLVVDREGQCSTHVEPSSSSELQATATGVTAAPNQVSDQDPQQQPLLPPVARPETPAILTGESGGPEIPAPQAGDSSLHPAEESSAQDLGSPSSSINADMLSGNQGQLTGQDGDSNDQDDQVIPPRSNEDIEARRQV